MKLLPYGHLPNRLALATMIGGAVLGTGAGVAYAATAAAPVETGYATVVDEGVVDEGAAGAGADCPSGAPDRADRTAPEGVSHE